jgi:ribosomal protein S18 acetylase RimI-like enzyme
MSHVSLRPADQRDTDYARAAHHSAYRDVVMRQFGRWDEEAQDAYFEAHWLSPGCVVIAYDGSPCGYARFEELPDHVRIHELVLSPEYQGRGIGSALLLGLQRQAEKGGTPVTLRVLKANRAAGLYERMGFATAGETETHKEMKWVSQEHRRS